MLGHSFVGWNSTNATDGVTSSTVDVALFADAIDVY